VSQKPPTSGGLGGNHPPASPGDDPLTLQTPQACRPIALAGMVPPSTSPIRTPRSSPSPAPYMYSGWETPCPLWTSSASDPAVHQSSQAPSEPHTPAPLGFPSTRGMSEDPFTADHMDTDSSSSDALALVESMVGKVSDITSWLDDGKFSEVSAEV
jgi:hypothetical protein